MICANFTGHFFIADLLKSFLKLFFEFYTTIILPL
jgi:hypothetical protein